MLTDALKKQIQGAYSQFLENKGLKSRYGQKLMIAEIAKALGSIKLDGENHRLVEERAGGHICVVEAGTGTGKTIAYLLPALVMAMPRGSKPTLVIVLVTRRLAVSMTEPPRMTRTPDGPTSEDCVRPSMIAATPTPAATRSSAVR